MKSKSTYGLFAVVCLVFGTTFLAIRLGLLAGASPILYSGLRFSVAGILMLGWFFLRGKASLARLLPLLPKAAVVSIFLTALTFGTMYWAEQYIDSGYMARLDSVGPIFTALFAALLLKKKLGILHYVGLALGTLGTFLLAGENTGDASVLPLLVALCGVLAYALGMVVYSRLFADEDDPVLVNALQMFLGGLVLCTASPLLETPSLPLTSDSLGPLLYLIFAGSILAHSANLVVVRDAGPVFASAWLYVAPALASLAGFLVLGENLLLVGILGTLAALAGVFLLSLAERSARVPVLPREGARRPN